MDKKIIYEKELLLVMSQRKALFNKTIIKAKKDLNNHNYELAAIYLQIAANYASTSHSGFYYSKEIEDITNKISENYIKKGDNRKFNNKANKVLHIASEVYDVGGHTRLIQNWIGYDPMRINDLVITNQTKKDAPNRIIEYFIKKESKVYFLKDEDRSILYRSQLLNDLSCQYDAIVLHIHPYDVIPLIAFAHSDIPILFMNHADHRFWIGKSVSNMILNIRNSGKLLSNSRRTVNNSNQSILPIPLNRRINVSKENARAELKINNEDMVIFSVASSYKYIPLVDDGIKEILLPLVNDFDNIKVIVVGPNISEEYWKDLYDKSQGKIEAVGLKSIVDYYYIASDLYLDSYPFSSLTSLLDAAKYGLPIFSIEKDGKGLDLDDISLDNIDFKSKSFDEIKAKMSFYICNEGKRKEFGLQCSEQVTNDHMNPNWLHVLDDIYERVINLDKIDNGNDSADSVGNFDLSLIYLHFKDKSREFEYYSCFTDNYKMFPFLEKIKYFVIISILALKEPSLIKVITPRKIKSAIKKIIFRSKINE